MGILARVPLASGMLTGKLRRDSQFAADDHRNFNRHGEMFDVGETFSGVDYELDLARWKNFALLPPEMSMAQLALRWILMFDAVSCAIPGGKRPGQVPENCLRSDQPPIDREAMAAIRRIYNENSFQRTSSLVDHVGAVQASLQGERAGFASGPVILPRLKSAGVEMRMTASMIARTASDGVGEFDLFRGTWPGAPAPAKP